MGMDSARKDLRMLRHREAEGRREKGNQIPGIAGKRREGTSGRTGSEREGAEGLTGTESRTAGQRGEERVGLRGRGLRSQGDRATGRHEDRRPGRQQDWLGMHRDRPDKSIE
eukprot:6209223-Pleurochrysis_carterae.AAC.3